MATLRKWQPVRRPQKRTVSAEKLLMFGGAAAIGFAVFTALQPAHQPAPNIIMPGSPEARRIEQQQARTLAEARRAEEAERTRQRAAIRAEQERLQAAMFNQRYNTDRTPVGSVGAAAPEAPAPQGFSVVKPAIPPGQTGGGFREVKWGRQGQ